MIKVIVSVDAYHDQYVAEDVDEIQKNGGEVIEIIRKEKMRLGIIGRDVTEIHYKANNEEVLP